MENLGFKQGFLFQKLGRSCTAFKELTLVCFCFPGWTPLVFNKQTCSNIPNTVSHPPSWFLDHQGLPGMPASMLTMHSKSTCWRSSICWSSATWPCSNSLLLAIPLLKWYPQVKWHTFPQIHFLPLLTGVEQSTNSNIFIKCVFGEIPCKGHEIDYVRLYEIQIRKTFTEESFFSKETPKPNCVLEFLDELILVNHKYITSSKLQKFLVLKVNICSLSNKK